MFKNRPQNDAQQYKLYLDTRQQTSKPLKAFFRFPPMLDQYLKQHVIKLNEIRFLGLSQFHSTNYSVIFKLQFSPTDIGPGYQSYDKKIYNRIGTQTPPPKKKRTIIPKKNVNINLHLYTQAKHPLTNNKAETL